MVLSKLLLEDEQVIMIVEDAVEVRLEQVRLHLTAHMSVGIQVQLLDLSGVETAQDLGLAGWVSFKDLIDLRKL